MVQKILTVCSPLFISWLVLLCLRALACCVWKFPEIDVNDPISFWKMTFSMLQLCNNAKKLTRTCKSWQYIKKSSERRWSADSDWKKMSWNYWWCNTAFFQCKVSHSDNCKNKNVCFQEMVEEIKVPPFFLSLILLIQT